MTLSEEANRLRLEIVRLGDPAKRQYPEELRKKILDWVARSKEAGMNERECADLLDISRQRFITWRSWRQPRARQPRDTKALVAVEVRSDAAAPLGPLTFVTPSGFRIEGLTIAEAMSMLRAFS